GPDDPRVRHDDLEHARLMAALDPAEIAALVRGEHGDPFAVLGPHAGAGGVWLRVLRPGALGVTALLDGSAGAEVALASIDPAGLFAALIEPAGAGPFEAPMPGYRLAVDYPHGHRELVEDPYRFGPGLGELDRYLLGEGTHLRPWTVLGA